MKASVATRGVIYWRSFMIAENDCRGWADLMEHVLMIEDSVRHGAIATGVLYLFTIRPRPKFSQLGVTVGFNIG
jgi:hypothetical protein